MRRVLFPSVTGFDTADLKLKGFKVYAIDTAQSPVPSYSRRDFYKICLVTGNCIVHYEDKSVVFDGSVLFFASPHTPYSSELLHKEQKGFACLFTEEFFKRADRSSIFQQSSLFRIGGTPFFHLNEKQKDFITAIFEKVLEEQDYDFVFKNDVIRNYLGLIMYEAVRMQPSTELVTHKTASSRITSLFFDLLEKQFPIESMERPLTLKTAQDYAKHLSVHVNHLNRSVRHVTGKSTTNHIAERVITEAKALLQHTNWSVSDIAYALGFSYPNYFNNYFKKKTGTNPKSFRG